MWHLDNCANSGEEWTSHHFYSRMINLFCCLFLNRVNDVSSGWCSLAASAPAFMWWGPSSSDNTAQSEVLWKVCLWDLYNCDPECTGVWERRNPLFAGRATWIHKMVNGRIQSFPVHIRKKSSKKTHLMKFKIVKLFLSPNIWKFTV